MSYKAKKSFGQNFLNDSLVLNRIVREILVLRESAQSEIYEIGTGLGALTKPLLDSKAKLHSIERDRDLIPILQDKFEAELQSGQLILNEADAIGFLKILFEDPPKNNFVLCGNLPYHLTSSVFFETAKLWKNISGAVYLIQKEVADRIVAEPNNKTYGILSPILQAIFEVQVVEKVPHTAFTPPPKVESAVLVLKPKKREFNLDWEAFVKLVKAAFSKRRKVLTNSLAEYPRISSILHKVGIDPKSRAENLSFEDYERILACL
ncbi:MAG: ribosomal RNA small subunit methyltransferase A [Deltaproteobacteria bacterium]|nr:ribosomal RNA small subunit methyltransferase A [Deltaproteobacteria bacterium]